MGGNPARLIRMRFSPEEIELLQGIAWWNWNAEKIFKYLDIIVGGNVQELVKIA